MYSGLKQLNIDLHKSILQQNKVEGEKSEVEV